MSANRRAALGGLAFLVFAVSMFYFGAELDLGSLMVPGPGALPKVALAGLVVLSLVLIARSLSGSDEPEPAAAAETAHEEPGSMSRVLVAIGLIAVFIAILPSLGFLIASTVLMVGLAMLGAEKPWTIGPPLAGVSVTIVAYFVFVRLLDVRMPSGTIWGQ
jgi:hypothetical protein